jgi:hypothetical protein
MAQPNIMYHAWEGHQQSGSTRRLPIRWASPCGGPQQLVQDHHEDRPVCAECGVSESVSECGLSLSEITARSWEVGCTGEFASSANTPGSERHGGTLARWPAL